MYSWKIDFTQRDRLCNYHLKTVTGDILRLMIKIETCAGSVKKPEPSSMVVSKEKTTVLLKCYAVGPKPGGQQVCGMDKNTRMGRLQARQSSFSA